MINDTQMDSGEKLQWECKAISRPRPTYRWLRNGLPLASQVMRSNPFFVDCTMKRLIIPANAHSRYAALSRQNASRHFFSFQGRVEIMNGELSIHKVQQTDSGMYQCVAENKYGAVYSNAELKILGEKNLDDYRW